MATSSHTANASKAETALQQQFDQQNKKTQELTIVLNELTLKNSKLKSKILAIDFTNSISNRNVKKPNLKKYNIMIKLISVYHVAARMRQDGIDPITIAEFERKHNAYIEFGEEPETNPIIFGLKRKKGMQIYELNLLIIGWLRSHKNVEFMPADIIKLIQCFYYVQLEASKVMMKPLLWNPIHLCKIKGSYWEHIDESFIRYDGKHFELHFCYHHRRYSETTVGSKVPESITFVSQKKAQTVLIGLKRLNCMRCMDYIRKSLYDMNEKEMTIDNLNILLNIIPTKKEQILSEQKLIQYGSNVSWLIKSTHDKVLSACGIPEKFFGELCCFHRLETRLKLWIFKQEFDEIYDLLLNKYKCVYRFCKNISNDENVKKLLCIIMILGNHMNSGTYKGKVYGFDIMILNK
eukprot:171878_1